MLNLGQIRCMAYAEYLECEFQEHEDERFKSLLDFLMIPPKLLIARTLQPCWKPNP